jgi:outer membrane biosynthesis protein TonB
VGIFGVIGILAAAPAGAQENLDSGKTGAQLFAANCAACHKSPQALSKSGGLFGLSGFLREHYTSSRETAATIATYLESLSPAPGKRTGATKRSAKGDEKKGDVKKDNPKLDVEKSGKTAKPAETKTSEPETSAPTTEPKIEPKIEPKSKAKRKSKTTEPKSDEAKPKETKAKDAKSSAPKPAAKPDKPEKSD